jgi:hypothetical protein
MLNDDARNVILYLGLSLAACAAGSGSGAHPPEGGSAAPPATPAPFEATLRASPPDAPSPAPGAASPAPVTPGTACAAAASGPVASAATPAPAPSESMECVVPPDPELDKESSWSREIGQRLERALATLQSCSAELTADDESLTLRLVYASDGSPVSQHVVTSTPGACAASECLKRGLASVRSPALIIDKASIDLNLSLARHRAPERSIEPVDPLTPEPLAPDAEGCVDPEVARLSRVAVRQIVSTTHRELQKCYGQGLQRNHSLTGKVNFVLVIGHDGAVSEAWAREATLGDCEAIQCMLTQFRGLHFPEPVGRSVRVLYPINYLLEQSPVTLR